MPIDRCAAHPGRPAVDRCPVCDRPRCGADAGTPGCAVCRAPEDVQGPVRRKAGDLERVTAAALAAYAVALLGGAVTQQYVQAPWLELFAPAVLGVVCAAAAVTAARHPRPGRLAQQVRVVCAVCAALGVAWGVQLDGSFEPVDTDRSVWLPYLIAAVAAFFWAAPPRPRKKKAEA